jgi:hypothetical protein
VLFRAPSPSFCFWILVIIIIILFSTLLLLSLYPTLDSGPSVILVDNFAPLLNLSHNISSHITSHAPSLTLGIRTCAIPNRASQHLWHRRRAVVCREDTLTRVASNPAIYTPTGGVQTPYKYTTTWNHHQERKEGWNGRRVLLTFHVHQLLCIVVPHTDEQTFHLCPECRFLWLLGSTELTCPWTSWTSA